MVISLNSFTKSDKRYIESARLILSERALRVFLADLKWKTADHTESGAGKERIMRRTGWRGIYYVMAVLLVCVIIGTSTLTVRSQEKTQLGADRKHYLELEKGYRDSICDILEQQGYKNSGVMLTYVEEDGIRQYTVLIHNKRITKLSYQEQELLKAKLQEVSFPLETCSFFHEFLTTNL